MAENVIQILQIPLFALSMREKSLSSNIFLLILHFQKV